MNRREYSLRRILVSLILSVSLPMAAPASGDFVVGQGATFELGNGSLAMGCGALRVGGAMHLGEGFVVGTGDVEIQAGGSLDGGNASIELAGDWVNNGTFAAGSSSVRLIDGCGRNEAGVCGTTTFADLHVTSAAGKQVKFESGTTQTVTDMLRIAGASGTPIQLRSKTPGWAAQIDLQGLYDLAFIDVQDHAATGRTIGVGPAARFDSVSGSNVSDWFTALQPAPLLSSWAIVGACLILIGVAAAGLRTEQKGESNA